MSEQNPRTGPKGHPLDCFHCGRWWVVKFDRRIDWPPVPPILGGDEWPGPLPEWICLACGAEYRDDGDSIVFTGRVVDDEELLIPGFATLREDPHTVDITDVESRDKIRVMKSYDDEEVF